MRAREEFKPWPVLSERLTELDAALNAGDILALRTLLLQLVSGYRPAGEVVDWVHMANATADPLSASAV